MKLCLFELIFDRVVMKKTIIPIGFLFPKLNIDLYGKG